MELFLKPAAVMACFFAVMLAGCDKSKPAPAPATQASKQDGSVDKKLTPSNELAAALEKATTKTSEPETPAPPATQPLQTPKLFSLLPEFVATPDGMAVDPEGNLIVACPNYADQKRPGCLMKITKERKISKWVEVPVLEETKLSCPMGIQFGPQGEIYVCDNQGWKGEPEAGKFKGRVLRLEIKDNKVEKCIVVAEGMEHPNGVRVRDGFLYVTQSMMTKVKDASGLMVSAVYKFKCTDQNIKCTNTLADKNILVTFLTQNKECQYGADGIVFDKAGHLYVGNFGDGAVHKVTLDADGTVKSNNVWAKDSTQLRTTDGMCIDGNTGIMYIADFSDNAVAMVTPEGLVKRIAQSPDTDGFKGELDQPGEPCVWNGALVVTCFDCVFGKDKVNTKTEFPAKMSQLELAK